MSRKSGKRLVLAFIADIHENTILEKTITLLNNTPELMLNIEKRNLSEKKVTCQQITITPVRRRSSFFSFFVRPPTHFFK